MKTFARLLALFVLLSATCASVSAQDKPRWITKGVASLEKERSNDSYTFREFEIFGGDIDLLRKERFNPLVDYLANTFGADSASAQVTLLSASSPRPATLNDAEGDRSVQAEYRVTFSAPMPMTFYAKLVDEYVSFDENVDMSFDYTLYQLFAISSTADGAVPQFDDYSYSRKYNTRALALSIVPGLGQMYKGHNAKGWVIIGGEVVFVGAAIYSQIRQHNYSDDAKNASDAIAPSYRSKSKSWRQVRDVAIVGACGLYVYNLLDAALSKGARKVVVNKASGTRLALSPSVMADPMASPAPAVTMSLTF